MLRLKDSSVDPTGLKTETLLGVMVAQSIFSSHGFDCVMTSINDSRHAAKSRHYIGFAVDVRSKHLPSELKDGILAELRSALPGFDVLLEQRGTENEHFHMEYDPRRT